MMQLTHEQVALIKKSWTVFRTMDPKLVCEVFYGKLFYEHPSLRRMFPRDMEEQYNKLMDMLNRIVARLDHHTDMTAEIQAMGKRHAAYGVKPEQYGPVGKALLWTLEQGLGSDWNEEVKEAWFTCYTHLATVMLEAAKTP
jgi:hemoglobin-like flavoprotein